MSSTKEIQAKIKLLTYTGVFAALIYIVTAFVHVPTGTGYTHPGDGLVYLAGSILPLPYAIAASAIGGGLADGLSGFVIWMPGTILIKALTATLFSSKTDKIICTRNCLAIIPAYTICVVLYSLYEGIVISKSFSLGAIGAAFAQTPAYTVQVILSAVLYVTLGVAIDKAKLKKRLFSFT